MKKNLLISILLICLLFLFSCAENSNELKLPSREAYPGFSWEKVTGAGLEFWGQNNGEIRVAISETLPGAFIEKKVNDFWEAQTMVMQKFKINNGKIEDVLLNLQDLENWNEGEKCVFSKDEKNSTENKEIYILMPSGDEFERLTELGKEEPIPYTCAGYGMWNSGTRYFEIHKSNPNTVLFVEIGQEMPLFDETQIIIK